MTKSAEHDKMISDAARGLATRSKQSPACTTPKTQNNSRPNPQNGDIRRPITQADAARENKRSI